MCYTGSTPDKCVPVGGFSAGEGCQLEHPEHCASGMCIDREWWRTGDECARVGGNLGGEPCNPVRSKYFNRNNCSQEAGLYCKPDAKHPEDFGYCACPDNTNWDKNQNKCVKK